MLKYFRAVALYWNHFLAIFIVSCAAPCTWAQDTTIQQRFREDMADCRHGAPALDLKNCEREARVARLEGRRGGLTDPVDQYQANALSRCAGFRGPDRSDCEARLAPSAHLAGSVQGGGILREATTPDTVSP
jgi:hypothetical protein